MLVRIQIILLVQPSEITFTEILLGLLQVWGVHQLHEAEMQGVMQTVLEENHLNLDLMPMLYGFHLLIGRYLYMTSNTG